MFKRVMLTVTRGNNMKTYTADRIENLQDIMKKAQKEGIEIEVSNIKTSTKSRKRK